MSQRKPCALGGEKDSIPERPGTERCQLRAKGCNLTNCEVNTIMNAITRRLRKLEKLEFRHRAEPGPSLAAIMLERRRKREIADEPEGGVRLRIPAFRPVGLRGPGLAECLNAGRDLCWRQSLFDQCQATSAETGRALTEQDRAAAQAHCAELELRCQKYGFASTPVFLQNCRDQGWLSCESLD
jgi:hypothetical protein